MDFMTDVMAYSDCRNGESYLYGTTPRRARRVVVTYNGGEHRRARLLRPPRGLGMRGRFYVAVIARAQSVSHVRAFARGGRLLDDIRIGWVDVCEPLQPEPAP